MDNSSNFLTTLDVTLIPIMSDNYVFSLHDNNADKTAIIDPGDDTSVLNFLQKNNLSLDYIFCTHHHYDHIDGIKKIKTLTNCEVITGIDNKKRVPFTQLCDKTYQDNESFDFGEHEIILKEVYGHTIGHVAYHIPKSKILFIGDTLFAMGCGRLFEGSFEQMFESLQWIKSLDPETMIYCAHEYTLSNALFAKHTFPNNKDIEQRCEKTKKLRAKQIPTVPFQLKDDLLTNPFLLAKNVNEFKKLRLLKNTF